MKKLTSQTAYISAVHLLIHESELENAVEKEIVMWLVKGSQKRIGPWEDDYDRIPGKLEEAQKQKIK